LFNLKHDSGTNQDHALSLSDFIEGEEMMESAGNPGGLRCDSACLHFIAGSGSFQDSTNNKTSLCRWIPQAVALALHSCTEYKPQAEEEEEA